MENRKQKEFFQRCLYEALIKLMRKKTFTEISISELCQEAGVSRMTYYRSYSVKEDILKQHLEECFGRFLVQLETTTSMSFYGVSVRFFEFWQGEEIDFLKALIDSDLAVNLMDMFYEYLEVIYKSLDLKNKVPGFAKSFLAGGLYKMLIDWVKDGARTPIEEMAEFLERGSLVLVKTDAV